MIVKVKHVGLIRLAYLLPILNAVVLLILACIPHLFYLSEGEVYDTLSLFRLMGNTYAEESIKETTAGLYFSFAMLAVWWISVACIVLYGIFCIATAAMTYSAWTPYRTPSKLENQLKRAYRIVVPNRGFYAFFHILPLIPSLFPYFLQLFAKYMLGQSMRVYYIGIPDFVVVLLLAAVSLTLFFVTLSDQKHNKMDLFRIFKIENN